MSSPWGAGADKRMKNAIGRAEIFSARLFGSVSNVVDSVSNVVEMWARKLLKWPFAKC